MKEQHRRQSFLGPDSEERIGQTRVAVVGLCGGGSHIVQQLAHIGVGRIDLFDFDRADGSNRNRMVGLSKAAADANELKTSVMVDLVRLVNPDIHVRGFPGHWQDHARELRSCHTIFGCVDSYEQRRQLECYARRYLVPYIDVGMDVTGQAGRHYISGQVIVSLPGHACLRCMGFLTDELLAQEAGQYGNAGGKPQVVWPNGVLASTAVGKFMSLLTAWHLDVVPPLYSEYDGNRMTVAPSKRLKYLQDHVCPHFGGVGSLGDPAW